VLGFNINRVTGDSMSPVLMPNSYVLLHSYFNKNQLKKGRIVKVDHPVYGQIIKRIAYQDKNGLYWLSGDGPNSVSTCEMGPVSAAQIKGVMLCRFL
jgi:nickel-type superoxide dismutase maturation protease